jgi:transposase
VHAGKRDWLCLFEATEDVHNLRPDFDAIARLDTFALICTAPGVGPVTATTFAATIDDASRFGAAKQVRSYLGLVPREYSSGERQHRGRISKAGSVRTRSLPI